MVSVIVPIYKVEKYLRSCVDSILQQTFSDIEIILVDDGSPDGCGAMRNMHRRIKESESFTKKTADYPMPEMQVWMYAEGIILFLWTVTTVYIRR